MATRLSHRAAEPTSPFLADAPTSSAIARSAWSSPSSDDADRATIVTSPPLTKRIDFGDGRAATEPERRPAVLAQAELGERQTQSVLVLAGAGQETPRAIEANRQRIADASERAHQSVGGNVLFRDGQETALPLRPISTRAAASSSATWHQDASRLLASSNPPSISWRRPSTRQRIHEASSGSSRESERNCSRNSRSTARRSNRR